MSQPSSSSIHDLDTLNIQDEKTIHINMSKLFVDADRFESLPIGSMFAHYKIKSELGRGGMGVVYKAYDTKLNRDVALKLIMDAELAPKRVKRLLREAAAMAQLNHPSIVQIYEVGEEPSPYFAMECIEGKTMLELIREERLRPSQAVDMIIAIGETLSVVHNKDIIHRDIKPSNIMLTNSGDIKLMDFGLVKMEHDDTKGLSKTGDVLGTIQYMSPEQVVGKVDTRSDIYSLGATLYQAITQRPPFQGESKYNIFLQISEDSPVPPRQLNPDIPDFLEAICLKCLEKNPENRYQTVKELTKDLRNFRRNRPVRVMPNIHSKEVPKGRSWRSLIIGILALVPLLSFVYLHQKNISIQDVKSVWYHYLHSKIAKEDQAQIQKLEQEMIKLGQVLRVHKQREEELQRDLIAYQEGLQLYYAERYAETIEKIKPVQSFQNQPWYWYQLGQTYRKWEKNALATAAFEKVLTLDQQHRNALIYTGYLYFENKNYVRAANMWQQAHQQGHQLPKKVEKYWRYAQNKVRKEVKVNESSEE